MPLKKGSSDKVIQDNIRCLLKKEGCGYDPPYLDPSRKEYTPAQAAAIAYAKAGRRNNAGSYKGKPDKEYKTDPNQKLGDGVTDKWATQHGVKVPGVKPKNAVPESDEEREEKKADKLAKEASPILKEAHEKYKKKKPEGNATPAVKAPPAKKPAPAAPAPKDPQPATPQVPSGWSTPESAAKAPQVSSQGGLKIDGKDYKPGKTLPGSTKPVLYEDENGNGAWVVKTGGAQGQNSAEHAANQIYSQLSADLPVGSLDSRMVDDKLVNKFIQNGKTLGQLTPDEMKKFGVGEKMRKSLIADALVANWDFAGLSNDNIMVDEKGNLVRIDSGGTFNFRAQGESKAFAALPMEIWSLRTSTQGKQFWANASEQDYKDIWTNQISSIVSSDKLIDVVANSDLSPRVKKAFNRRIMGLWVVNQELKKFIDKNGEPKSWKAVDQALKKAFTDNKSKASDLSSASTGWSTVFQKSVAAELGALAQTPSASASTPGSVKDPVLAKNLENLKKAFPKIDWEGGYWDGLSDALKSTYVNSANSFISRSSGAAQQNSQNAAANAAALQSPVKINWKYADDPDFYNGPFGDIPNAVNKYSYNTTVNRVNDMLDSQSKNPDYTKKFGDSNPLKPLSPEAKFMLHEYTGSLFSPLNKFLRTENADTSSAQAKFLSDAAKIIQDALSKLPNHKTKNEFWRMNSVDRKHVNTLTKIANLKPGDIYSSGGFDSYTDDHDGNVASRNRVLDTFYKYHKESFITVYNGNKVKNITPASSLNNERESLTMSNQEFRVTKIEMHPLSNYPQVSWGGEDTKRGKIKVIYLEDA